MTSRPTEVVCTKIAKQSRGNKTLVFSLTAVWSNGTREELVIPYVAVFDFHTRLKDMLKTEDNIQLPDIPPSRKLERNFLFGNVEKKKGLVEEYFKKLLQLPERIVSSDIFREFFERHNSENSWGSSTMRKEPVAKTPSGNCATYDFINDSDMGHYESVKDLELPPPAAIVTSQQPCDVALVDPSTAEEHIYWACKDYQKRHSGEVTLVAGSSVSVLQKDLSGWWFVEAHNQQGWAPASVLLPADRRCLATIAETKPLGEYIAVRDCVGSGPDEVSYRKDDKVQVLEAKLDGWWKVSCGGVIGYTPATNLEAVEKNTDANVYHHHSIYSKRTPPPRRKEDESIEELYARVDKLKRPLQLSNSSAANENASTATSVDSTGLYSEIGPSTRKASFQKRPPPQATAPTTNNNNHTTTTLPLSNRSGPPSSKPPPIPAVGSPVFAKAAAANPQANAVPDADASGGYQKQLSSVRTPPRSPAPPGSPAAAATVATPNVPATHSKPKPATKPTTRVVDKPSVDSTVNGGDHINSSPTSSNGGNPATFEFNQATGNSGSDVAGVGGPPKPPPIRHLSSKHEGPSAAPSSSTAHSNAASAESASNTTKTSGVHNTSAMPKKGKSLNLPVVNIGRADCDELLMTRGKVQDYIIRDSTKPGCPYALSVHCGDRVLHFPLELTVDRKYYIGKFSFDSLDAVISYYTANTLCHVPETGSDIMLDHLFQVCRL